MGNCWRRKRCEYFVEIRCWNSLSCIATSHTNTHTVRSRPTPKNEIRHFRNGLVRELKVDERKLLRHSKRLCSNRRKQFLGSQCHTSYLEKILGREMCIKFESDEISTTGDDCSKSYAKEKEVRSFALHVDKAMDCQQGEAKHSYRGFVTVVRGVIIIVLLLALFRRVGVYILVFVLRVTVFHVIILLRCCTWIILGVEIVHFQQVL